MQHSGPRMGEPIPDFDLELADGGHLRKRDLVGTEPVVLVFGSVTDPLTRAAIPRIDKLWRELAVDVAFAFVYVREARPDSSHPRPRTRKDRRARALELRKRFGRPFPVALDKGGLSRALRSAPASLYVMDHHGNLAGRVRWAGDVGAARKAIRAALLGMPPYATDRRTPGYFAALVLHSAWVAAALAIVASVVAIAASAPRVSRHAWAVLRSALLGALTGALGASLAKRFR
jgi:hypothetical protein